jgi:hypothetical protein
VGWDHNINCIKGQFCYSYVVLGKDGAKPPKFSVYVENSNMDGNAIGIFFWKRNADVD